MQDFRNLRVWQAAHALTLETYRETSTFPSSEQFALTSQIRRAAISIPANLAEGCGRGSDRDFGRYVQIAIGSASELEYHLLLAADLFFISTARYDELRCRLIEVKRMLIKLALRLKAVRPRRRSEPMANSL